jgi:uncharacterized iron-regulated protein
VAPTRATERVVLVLAWPEANTRAYADRMGRRLRVAVVLALAVVGCARATDVRLAPWRAPLGRDHPLAGRIWDVRGARFVDAHGVVARLTTARYVLLGEKHDNPDHHQIQATLLRALLATGRRPAVAFEMFTADQAPAIAGYLARAPRDAAGLADAVDWKRSGWPDWGYYRPIAQAALEAGVPVIAANLTPATVRSIARGEAGSVPAALASRYALDQPMPTAAQARLAAELAESHCGQLPAARLATMLLAQRTRDAMLADSLLGADADGAVLIAGVGHVRDDHGVPIYLRGRAPGAPIAVVAPLEVHEGWTRAEDYAAAFGGGLPFDWVWFTPRVDDTDPCASMPRLKPST